MLAHVDHTHIPVLVPPRWACDSYSLALVAHYRMRLWGNWPITHEIIIGSMLAHVDHTHIPVLVPRWACDSYSLAL